MKNKIIAALLCGLLLVGVLLVTQSERELVLYDSVEEALADPKVAAYLEKEYPELFQSEEQTEALYAEKAAELSEELGRPYSTADVAELYEKYGLASAEKSFENCQVLVERNWFGITHAEILDGSQVVTDIAIKKSVNVY